MGKFDGILICTDLDGTLLKNDKTVSKENLNAIEYFKANGGKFTFITGRMQYYAVDTYNTIKPNAPVGCINGGGLFDYTTQSYIWKCELADDVRELIKSVDEHLPEIGIVISGFYHSYFCKDNEALQWFRKQTNLPYITADYKTFDNEPIGKILFATDDETSMQKLAALLKTHPCADKFGFIRSEQRLYEILPKGIGKGTIIEKLAEHLHMDIRRCIAVGDYNNDISMIKAAGVGIAVKNACQEALAAADVVTVSNEEHAIAKIIDDIDKGIIAF